jgi:transposase-like protein
MTTIPIPESVTMAVHPSDEPMSLQVGPRAQRASRRLFTAEYKRSIVAEYDAAPFGHKGAVLRRERLYDSHVLEWRAQIAAGTLEASRRGPRAGVPARTSDQAEIAKLRKQVTALEHTIAVRDDQLGQTRHALDVLGKAVAFLEALSSRNA